MIAKHRRKTLKHHNKPVFGSANAILFFFALLITIFYLWGSVQIDFILRENDHLESERRELESGVNTLRVQVDGLKSYQRIVRLAREQGLVFVPASRLAEIPVDLRGTTELTAPETWGIQMAGFGISEMISQDRLTSDRDGRRNAP